MKKRTMLAMLAVLAMMAAPLSAGVISAFAERSIDPEGYEYEMEGDSVRIVYYDREDWEWDIEDREAPADQVIEIPAEIDGEKVKVIGYNAFRENPYMKEVIIPDGVEVIEDEAFFRVTNEKSLTITIPASVEYIGSNIVYVNTMRGGMSEEAQNAVSLWINGHQYQIRMHEYKPDRYPLPEDMELYESLDIVRFNCGDGLYTKDGRKVDLSEVGIEDTGNAPSVTIRGYSGSYAEEYANRNDIHFESIGQAPLTGSTFSGGKTALAGIGGLALGIAGTALVTLPKKKKND